MTLNTLIDNMLSFIKKKCIKHIVFSKTKEISTLATGFKI